MCCFEKRDFVGSAWGCVFQCVHVSEHEWSEYICIIVNPCLMMEPFYFVFLFRFVLVSMCMCVYVWLFGYECDTQASVPLGEWTEEPLSSSQGLIYPIFY